MKKQTEENFVRDPTWTVDRQPQVDQGDQGG